MIGSTRSLRVWAYPAPADLRKGFDGLSGLVTRLGQDPLAGDCFLFVNRLRTRAKVLLWDGTGLCVYHKRLEQGRFAALWAPDGAGTAVRHTPHPHGALAGTGDAADVDAGGGGIDLTAS
jgi:transposase